MAEQLTATARPELLVQAREAGLLGRADEAFLAGLHSHSKF
jgi:hypothetical protein